MTDDDKTRLGPRPASTPVAGGNGAATSASAPTPVPHDEVRGGSAPNALAPGFVLREFEIERVIGEGGFSVVYLAIDRQLVRRIAIKEYMPSALAVRVADLSIAPKSERVRDTFEAGLRSFVNEARLLAQFDHPALVKVYRFWEERGTAYMVMPYYNGITLSQWRRQHGPADEPWLRRLLYLLLDALQQLHGQNCYHRDIAPDNILLLPGDHPVLLDLGAARQIIGDMTQALTVILKPGYAPVEQYAAVASMKQGAWTDLYALAAVLYFVIAGRAPPPAVARMVNDDMPPAREVGAGRYSDALLGAIDAALCVLPEKRPQSIDAFRVLLGLEATRVLAGSAARTFIGRAMSSPAIPGGGMTPADAPPPQPSAPAPEPLTAASQPARRPWRLVASALVAAFLAGGVLLWLSHRQPAPPSARKGPPATATASVPSNHELLLRVLDARSPAIDVRAMPSATSLVVDQDSLSFSLASNSSGYVYVLLAGTDAKHLFLLFPNPKDENNAINANETMVLPRKTWSVYAPGPPGVDRLLVLVSPRPRDFSAAGLREGKYFGEFLLSELRSAIATQGPVALAGRAQCEANPCDTSFGAAMFEVTEVAPPGQGGGATK
jgi:serine/threonine protein kinase